MLDGEIDTNDTIIWVKPVLDLSIKVFAWVVEQFAQAKLVLPFLAGFHDHGIADANVVIRAQ